jgi:hypothetical protein
MQTFTIGWPHRWPFHGLGRNELLRFSDRIESIALLIFGIAAIIAVPFAVSIGMSVHDFEAGEQARHAVTAHEAMATVVGDSETLAQHPFHVEWSVPVRWNAAGGSRQGSVAGDAPRNVGTQVPIWLDQNGELTKPPVAQGSSAADGVGVAVVVWLAVIAMLGGVLQLIRWRLDAGRLAQWDRELESLADDGGGRSRR